MKKKAQEHLVSAGFVSLVYLAIFYLSSMCVDSASLVDENCHLLDWI
jgi:hypothetical protein